MRDEIRIFGASLINKAVEDANSMANFAGYTIRVVERDGEKLLQTMDLKFNRINVRVKNNIIFDVSFG